MDIVIRGGSFVNKGAEAMVLTVQRELSRRLPGSNFHLRLPSSQAVLAQRFGLLTSVSKGSRTRKLAILLPQLLLRAELRRAFPTSRSAALQIASLGSAHAVIDVGGLAYTDAWGAGLAREGYAWARFCRDRHVPYVCMPQSWGPFAKADVARNVRGLCLNANLIYARDEVSLGYVRGILQDGTVAAQVGPDVVFRFAGAPPETGRVALADAGIRVGQSPLVGLAPNLRVYERQPGKGADSRYVKSMIALGRFCARELGAKLVLIPHEIACGQSSSIDDRYLCGLIACGLYGDGGAAALVRDYSADTLRAIVGHLDLLIASRFHSIVFALSARVPAVVCGWHHKYEQIMADVGLERFVIPAQGTAEDGTAGLTLVREAWERRDQLRENLSVRLPRMTQAVDAIFDRVAAVIRQPDETSRVTSK